MKTKIPFVNNHADAHQMRMMNRDRNEPCTMIQTLEVVSELLKMDKFALADIVWDNSHKFYGMANDIRF